ncbi:MAG: biotin/lipoyl-binding protein, partial [Rhodothermales bacterium]|nr:biotin/lipoyl-binding protein [Rhodothermales bacterium]
MPSEGEAGQHTPARDSSDHMPHARRSRLFRPWQAAGVLSLAAALALGVYAFWPRLVGSADVVNDRGDRKSDRIEVRAPVDVMVASPTDLVLLADATGHLAPWRSADIGAGASGLVKERLVEEGSRVTAGDVLLRLDDRGETIALKEARNRVLEAQIRYADIRIGSAGRKDADTVRVSVAEDAFERARRAFETGSITPEEMRLARREFDAAVLRSGARRAEVEAILSGLEQAEQALERDRLQLSRTTVRAPFTGLIADI